MPTEDELARQLIDLVRETTAPEAVLLQRRIDTVLGYLSDVVAPNMHTVAHVRRILTGEWDHNPNWWAEQPGPGRDEIEGES